MKRAAVRRFLASVAKHASHVPELPPLSLRGSMDIIPSNKILVAGLLKETLTHAYSHRDQPWRHLRDTAFVLRGVPTM